MAEKIQVLLVDDIDGGEATETVNFGLDGVAYEIDLSSDNAKKLRKEPLLANTSICTTRACIAASAVDRKSVV